MSTDGKWSGLMNWVWGFVLGITGENIPLPAEEEEEG